MPAVWPWLALPEALRALSAKHCPVRLGSRPCLLHLSLGIHFPLEVIPMVAVRLSQPQGGVLGARNPGLAEAQGACCCPGLQARRRAHPDGLVA